MSAPIVAPITRPATTTSMLLGNLYPSGKLATNPAAMPASPKLADRPMRRRADFSFSVFNCDTLYDLGITPELSRPAKRVSLE
jgi:hypothetical protein